ncbi:MAG: DUF7146 domain-containing protein [Deferrisomatales bacterium]
MRRPRLDAATVKARARGRWLHLLPTLVPDLADALARAPRHVPCPRHGGADGFRMYADAADTGGGVCNSCGAFPDGLALLRWANGWTFPEALAAVAGALGIGPEAHRGARDCNFPRPPASTPVDPEKACQEATDAARRRDALRRVWAEARAIQADGPVDSYLKSRGLDLLGKWPQTLRYHTSLSYHEEGQTFGPFPAMLARIDGADGEPAGVHRTYLRADGSGKAPVPTPKKLMPSPVPGATTGGAVRLFPAGPVLAVAEGIETALAVHLATGFPTWAAVSAGGMARVTLPPDALEVIVCADHDRSGAGQAAARTLARRLLTEGRRVRIALPPEPGTDFADLYVRGGGA